MSEAAPVPKKRKKATIVRGVKPSTVSERVRRFELARTAPTPLPSLGPIAPPVVEQPPVRPVALPRPPPPPVEVPIDITSQEGPVDYDRLFRALEQRKVAQHSPPVEQAAAEVEDRKESLLSQVEEIGFREEFQRQRPVPADIAAPKDQFFAPAPPAEPELTQFEQDAYRRIERENSDALKGTLRAQAHEHAIYNGSRVSDPRFSKWYAVHHTHALDDMENRYMGKLRDGSVTFPQVRRILDELLAAQQFKPWEVDHVFRHLSANWIRERRIGRYEERGLIRQAGNLSDIYSGIDRDRAFRQRQRNIRKSERI